MTEKIHVPSGVAALRDALIREGFRACPVGGCVRDSLLGRTPEDWDICTSARPERILALFPGSVIIALTECCNRICIFGC